MPACESAILIGPLGWKVASPCARHFCGQRCPGFLVSPLPRFSTNLLLTGVVAVVSPCRPRPPRKAPGSAVPRYSFTAPMGILRPSKNQRAPRYPLGPGQRLGCFGLPAQVLQPQDALMCGWARARVGRRVAPAPPVRCGASRGGGRDRPRRTTPGPGLPATQAGGPQANDTESCAPGNGAVGSGCRAPSIRKSMPCWAWLPTSSNTPFGRSASLWQDKTGDPCCVERRGVEAGNPPQSRGASLFLSVARGPRRAQTVGSPAIPMAGKT